MPATAAASSISPVIQARAASAKMVRPTAKPFTRANPAAVSNDAASAASGASSPSTTMPRVWGSCSSIAAIAFAQAARDVIGSSFHQSGKMPAA